MTPMDPTLDSAWLARRKLAIHDTDWNRSLCFSASVLTLELRPKTNVPMKPIALLLLGLGTASIPSRRFNSRNITGARVRISVTSTVTAGQTLSRVRSGGSVSGPAPSKGFAYPAIKNNFSRGSEKSAMHPFSNRRHDFPRPAIQA